MKISEHREQNGLERARYIEKKIIRNHHIEKKNHFV